MYIKKNILVSACLLGDTCAYDAKNRTSLEVKGLASKVNFLKFCPEICGGLKCPRVPHEIANGTGLDVINGKARVFSKTGQDHTLNFIKGAELALKKALDNNVSIAIMKSKSPSCGKSVIYNGIFNNTLRKGSGVTTALLIKNDIKVFTEDEISQLKK